MKPSVMVSRRLFPQHLRRLDEHFTLDLNPTDQAYSQQELMAHLAGKEAALITGSDRIDAALFEAIAHDTAPRLRAICSISVGLNHIDVAACTQRGIWVTNTPDVLTETTADLGWALMMAAARRITESERWLRAGQWQGWALDQWTGVDLHHTTIGIIGMGRIGQALARRARGFAMRVLYHNRSRLPPDIEAECGAQYVDLPALLQSSDHVMMVAPYTPANHHMIGAAELALMKPTATITNIARGGLIDEVALIAALQEGRIAAAGLDVYEGEPRFNKALLDLNNVALTPHIGSATRATRDAMANLAIDNLIAALNGQRPSCLVNPEVLQRRS